MYTIECDYENDQQNTEMSWQVHDGGDHLVTDHDGYVRSSAKGAKTTCRLSSRSSDKPDYSKAVHC